MGRYRFNKFNKATTARYLLVTGAQQRLIEHEYHPPGADLRAAMAALLDRLSKEGWTAEHDAAFGFTFINRGGERLLVSITERNPADDTPQSFSPFSDR
jgi:hypothetical protein